MPKALTALFPMHFFISSCDPSIGSMAIRRLFLSYMNGNLEIRSQILEVKMEISIKHANQALFSSTHAPIGVSNYFVHSEIRSYFCIKKHAFDSCTCFQQFFSLLTAYSEYDEVGQCEKDKC